MSDAMQGDPATSRVRDIMRTDVVTVRPETTVRELVRILAERGIGGVPVLDADGGIVGIVTATDLIRLAAEAAKGPLDDLVAHVSPGSLAEQGEGLLSFLASSGWGDSESLAPLSDAADGASESEYEEYTVGDIMRPVRHPVRPGDSLVDLARVLLEAHVHRAVVVEEDRLVGIVTTFDVLRAVAGLPAQEQPAVGGES
jgi:CBS domain-containing protein